MMAHYTFEQVDPSGALIDLSGHRHRAHLVGDAHLRTMKVAMPPVGVVTPPCAAPVVYGGVPAATTTTMKGSDLIDLRRYQPTGRGARFNLRLRGTTAKGELPAQYRYQIGGLGSIRGYDDKASVVIAWPF
ncbi:MAG TPA: hypothetical protein QF604_04620 [Candidatus Latescibacteria bacterium]|nr:hypothetical protein [Candidatus Latescibacterota bacterium]